MCFFGRTTAGRCLFWELPWKFPLTPTEPTHDAVRRDGIKLARQAYINMIRNALIVIAISAVPIFVSAQNAPTQGDANPFGFLQGLFSPKPTELTKLIDENKLFEADNLVAKEWQFFWVENKKDQTVLLKRLASGFNSTWDVEFDSSIGSLSKITEFSQERWAEHKKAIAVADGLSQEYVKLKIFSEPDFRSPKLAQMTDALNMAKSSLVSLAPSAFESFDHASQDNFFSVYPNQLPDSFLSDNAAALQGFIKTQSPAQIVLLKSKYGEKIPSDGKFSESLSDRFFEVSLPVSSTPPPIGQVLAAIKNARAAGFPVKNLPGAKIAFVEVTSKTLLSEGQIEFPTQIAMDLPFEPVKTDVDSILDTTSKVGANIIVVLDVATSKVSRRILAKNDISSRFVSGSRNDPNPEYEVARGRLFQAQSGLANARNQSSGGGLAGAIISGIAMGLWSTRVTEAQNAFAGTPSTIKIDEFQPYKYSSSDVAVTRNLTANYYVIDKTTNRYFKGVFDIAENKSFKITYNLHDRDPERGKILSQFAKEADIADYEQSPVSLKVSMIIDDYLKNEANSKSLQSVVALRADMLADKNKALTAYKSNQYNAKPINDARFDSVVVMNNPKGAMGTGFFVAPDLILTNYHVIEGAQFLEMKLYNGLETFGKVVKTDVRLDLALVRVQTRGTPVNFFQGNTLDLGATVDAIGHPKGLTFTITRGIVSAVRKRPSVFGVGGKDVLFVQTDTAINPGNSGGPLFIGDKVVGVNNNKIVAGSEGLGFSVHYSEVKEFLKESF